jgi:hypothetical protein
MGCEQRTQRRNKTGIGREIATLAIFASWREKLYKIAPQLDGTEWEYACLQQWPMQRISLEVRAIVIRPVEDALPNLEQRLSRFDPTRHGGEVMQCQATGAEQW